MRLPRYFPSFKRLSFISSAILLAFVLANFVNIPSRTFELNLPGFYFGVELNSDNAITLLICALTAVGGDWFIKGHPNLKSNRALIHWILPTLTTWIIGIPLTRLPFTSTWWLWLFLSGSLLILIFIAEYISIDQNDVRYPIASLIITSVSYALFLFSAIYLRNSGARLISILVSIGISYGLVNIRVIYLKHSHINIFPYFITGSLIIIQFSASVYYLPSKPIIYGLIILAPSYALNIFLTSLAGGEAINRKIIIEPILSLLIIWGLAIWMV